MAATTGVGPTDPDVEAGRPESEAYEPNATPTPGEAEGGRVVEGAETPETADSPSQVHCSEGGGGMPQEKPAEFSSQAIRTALREELATFLPNLMREHLSSILDSAFTKLTETLQESITTSLGPHHAGSALKGSQCGSPSRSGHSGKRQTVSFDAGDEKSAMFLEPGLIGLGKHPTIEADLPHTPNRPPLDADGTHRTTIAPPPPPTLPPEEEPIVAPPNVLPPLRPPSPKDDPQALPSWSPTTRDLPGELPSSSSSPQEDPSENPFELPPASSSSGPTPGGEEGPANHSDGTIAVSVDPGRPEASSSGASNLQATPPGQALRTLVLQKRQSCGAEAASGLHDSRGRLSSIRSSTPIAALVGNRFSRRGALARGSIASRSSPRSSRASLMGGLFLPLQAPAPVKSLPTSPRSSKRSSVAALSASGDAAAAPPAPTNHVEGPANDSCSHSSKGEQGLLVGGRPSACSLLEGEEGHDGAAQGVGNGTGADGGVGAVEAGVAGGGSGDEAAADMEQGVSSNTHGRRSLFDAERAAMAAKRGRGALLRAMTHLGLGRGSVGISRVEELPRAQVPVDSQTSNAADSLNVASRNLGGRTSVANSNKRFSKMSFASGAADVPSEFVPSQSSESATYLNSQASSRWKSGGWALIQRRQGATLNTEQIDPLGDSEEVTKKWAWRWPFRDPNSFPRMVWDSCGFVLFALQVIYLPFRYAFIMDNSEVSGTMALCDHFATAIDFFWLLDLVLNFTTGYYSMQVLVSDSRSVAKHYLGTWFVIDLLASTPRSIDRFIDFFVPGGFNFWALHFMYFLRVLRLPRLSRLMRFLERALKSREVTSGIALIKPFVLLVVISHCTACALWALGRGNLEIDPERDSWIKDGLNIENVPNALKAISLRDRYICAMYFSLTVMSTVGLGDITAKLPNERGLLMVLMITTSVIVGVAVNGVAQFVSKLDEHSKQTNERLVKVSNFLRWYGVPQQLQGRVHAYLQQFFENQDREEVKIGLMEWIKKSDVLRADLNLALTGQCLARHRLLGMVPRAALLDICDVCEMVFHPPGEVLQTPGAEVSRCFYIRSGSVQLGDPERTSSWPRRNREVVAAKCVCGNTFMNDAVFCRKCGAPRSQATPVASSTNCSERKGPPTPSGGRNDKRIASTTPDEVQELEDIIDPGEQWRWDSEMDKLDNHRESGAYSGGSFLGDLRLFIGVGLTMRTAKCTRFTELISLDILTFRQKLQRKNPELLHSLALYAAIEVDCGYIMSRGYKAWEQHPDDSLLAGETGLHECAKQNSPKCAGELLNLGANVEAVDIDDLSAAQLAASLKHRDVFRVLVLAGARLTDNEVLSQDALKILDDEPDDDIDALGASKICASSVPSGVSLTMKPDRLDLSSFFDVSLTSSTQQAIEAFRAFVERHELDLSESVKNGTKGVHELYHEIKDGECTLEVLRGRRLRRKVVLVRVRLMAVVDAEVRALVELQTPHWLRNPACRMARWPTKRIRCRPLCDPAAECEELLGSLGLPPDFIMSHLAHVSRATYVEVKHSMSYPGLETEYTIIETCLRIRKLGVQSAESIGLPGGTAFERSVNGGLFGAQPDDDEEAGDESDRRTYFWAVMNSVRADDGKDDPTPTDRDQALLQARQVSKGEGFLDPDGSKESKGRFTNFHLGRRMSSLRWNSTPTGGSQSSRQTPTQLLRMTMTVEEEEAEGSEGGSRSDASSRSGR